jgi:hypothetical protein
VTAQPDHPVFDFTRKLRRVLMSDGRLHLDPEEVRVLLPADVAGSLKPLGHR